MKRATIFALLLLVTTCTQEQQNRISRSIQNWTGANGVLDILNGGKVAYRFIKIDKISTAEATSGSMSRPLPFWLRCFRSQSELSERRKTNGNSILR